MPVLRAGITADFLSQNVDENVASDKREPCFAQGFIVEPTRLNRPFGKSCGCNGFPELIYIDPTFGPGGGGIRGPVEFEARGLRAWFLRALCKTDQVGSTGIFKLLGKCLVPIFLGKILGLIVFFRR